jgi:hypothetical protein
MAWMVPIYLVWVLEGELLDVNRVASLVVRFPPSRKHILLTLFGVGFEVFGINHLTATLSNTKKSKNLVTLRRKKGLEM